MADHKDWKAVVEELQRQGWRVTTTTRGHHRAMPADPKLEMVHFSTSEDHHAFKNVLRDLRQRGFVWPPPAKNDLAVERRLESEGRPEPAIACEYVHCGEPGGCPVHSPGETPTPETPEQKMDRLFAELKEAKTYAALTAEELAACKRRVEEATLALSVADTEHTRAVEAMQALKTEFDRAFEAAA